MCQRATGHPAAMPLMVKVGLVGSFGATHAHLGREIISQKANGSGVGLQRSVGQLALGLDWVNLSSCLPGIAILLWQTGTVQDQEGTIQNHLNTAGL